MSVAGHEPTYFRTLYNARYGSKLAYSGYPNPDKGTSGLSQLQPINVIPKS